MAKKIFLALIISVGIIILSLYLFPMIFYGYGDAALEISLAFGTNFTILLSLLIILEKLDNKKE